MNYLQILSTPVSALRNISEERYADLLLSAASELTALRRMQTTEYNAEIYRSRLKVILQLHQTLDVLCLHQFHAKAIELFKQKAKAFAIV